jgi:hypothetical protein
LTFENYLLGPFLATIPLKCTEHVLGIVAFNSVKEKECRIELGQEVRPLVVSTASESGRGPRGSLESGAA